MQNPIRLMIITCIPLLLNACANFSTGNLFSNYSEQNQEVRHFMQQGDYQNAAEALPDSIAGDILDNMEKGRIAFLSGQYEQSLSYLTDSDTAVKEQEQKAQISLSESAVSLGSLAVNDNLNIYHPADYELGFLHLYLGLNYLQQNKLDDALVEMRRANQVQERAQKERSKELSAAENRMKEQGLSPNLGSVLSHYPDAGKTLQAVQNGYLLYLSALLYEADGNWNDAWIDYQRALAVVPENREVVDGAIRVGHQLGMTQEVTQLVQRYGQPQTMPKGEARVIIMEEVGVVNALEGWRLSLPLYDSHGNLGVYSLALPHYTDSAAASDSGLNSRFALNGKALSASLLSDVNNMAEYHLSERLPAMVLRQALRVWAKDRLRKEAEKQGGGLGGLVLNVWNTLTEQPDTRSWLTLPSAVFSRSGYVLPGNQTVTMNGQQYSFHIEAGQTVLVWISRQGSHATIWHKSLGKW